MWRYLLLMLCVFSMTSAVAYHTNNYPIHRIIYITFDGTRWQDVFLERVYFPKLWGKYAKNAIFYGMRDSHTAMEVASIPISLPSYHSQMSGAVQPCDGNECGRIKVETLTENIVHQLKLNKKEVAVFASWPEIGLAAESVAGTIVSNVGNVPMVDPDTQLPDQMMDDINQQQAMDHPAKQDRLDKYTFAQGLHYLEKYQPRFLWISLDDADEAAHAGNLDNYHAALSFYDDALDILFTRLKALHMDQDTLVIVTTDHGRGNGLNWIHHGPLYPESKQTWAFVINGQLKSMGENNGIAYYSTLSIRPTIEKALEVGS